jgi:penicillin-binding protein 1B
MKFPKHWPWGKIILAGAAVTFSLILVWAWRTDQSLRRRLSEGWFAPPVEFFSSPRRLQVGQAIRLHALKDELTRWGWRPREAEMALRPHDFKLLNAEECVRLVSDFSWPDEAEMCLGYWPTGGEQPIWLVEKEGHLVAVISQANELLQEARLPAERFAQYYQGEPILREVVSLGQVPLECAQAVTAIEDSDFLTHRGISPTAIARAMVRNLKGLRFAEGGSTITQQLVKNYFLTSEKRLSRKLKEQAMALLLELRVDKDEILINYLNEIYMGQNGSFQVRGFGAAADFYFGKRLADLNLPECALLAAVVNNPGRYNPFRQVEKAVARRKLVLARMHDLGMISEADMNAAAARGLGTKTSRSLSEPAPYFVRAVWDQIDAMGIDQSRGLRIFTTLAPELQERAQTGVLKHLQDLENRLPNLKTAARGPLQAAVLMIDVATGEVGALVGGRQYKVNQFNRINLSRRQPGSLFKPIVYLAALETGDYDPATMLSDEPWTHKYEGQTWKPKNYDGKFRGQVSMTEALAMSLNIPTARLAVDLGVATIIELARRLGIDSQLAAVPALALGAAEVTPLEMGRSYLTLARRGEKLPAHLITRIETLSGEEIFTPEIPRERVVSEETAGRLIEMMRATFTIGSAAPAAKFWTLPDQPAGKTGTTSDTRDAWFIGFNETLLTLVWIGFDDNTPTGLTGAGVALPLWYKIHYGK